MSVAMPAQDALHFQDLAQASADFWREHTPSSNYMVPRDPITVLGSIDSAIVANVSVHIEYDWSDTIIGSIKFEWHTPCLSHGHLWLDITDADDVEDWEFNEAHHVRVAATHDKQCSPLYWASSVMVAANLTVVIASGGRRLMKVELEVIS